jgi:hypothetical protein
MIKSRRMRWAHINHRWRPLWLESQKERDHYEGLDIGRKIILK